MTTEDPTPLGELHKHLLKPGVTQGPTSHSDHQEAKRLQVSRAASLRDLDDYVFFTPGLVFTCATNVPDLFASFTEETGFDPGLITMQFDRPLFRNIGMDWDNVLFGAAKVHWEALKNFMGTVALHDADKGIIWRVRHQTTDVLDPLLKQRVVSLNPADLVEIEAFWVESTDGCRLMDSKIEPGIPRAIMVRDVVFPQTLRFTQALLREDGNPYGAADEPSES